VNFDALNSEEKRHSYEYLLRRSKITWGWGTTMRNLGVPFSYFFRKLGVPSKNKNLSCYYLFAKKENN